MSGAEVFPLKVVCAVIRRDDGKFLLCRRSPQMKLPGKWEFPGGKVELGETATEALQREMAEELGVAIECGQPLTPVYWQGPDLDLMLLPYECRLCGGEPRAIEHDQIGWYPLADLEELDLADADRPVVRELHQQLSVKPDQ